MFEVSRLEITFNDSNDQAKKEQLISEGMEQCLRKYASNTRYKCSSKFGYDCENEPKIVVTIKLEKEISLITTISILKSLIGEDLYHLEYKSKEVKIIIL